jgi:signal transduction histidine kinase
MPSQTPPPGDQGSGPGEKIASQLSKVPSPHSPLDRLTLRALIEAQNHLIQTYFRLERLERKLSRQARDKLPATGRQAIRQIELERQRLGRDLHTGIGQALAAMHLQVETIEQQLPAPPPGVRQALDRISELTNQALDQVRAVSRRLHPPEWQRLSLAEAVRQLWALSGLPERVETRLSIDPELPEPELEVKILIYRALQEALANIARHSGASSVAVSLQRGGRRLVLTVSDNGKGFDAAALWRSAGRLNAGIGLRSIRDQAIAIGGELMVRSGPEGTTLEVSVTEEPSTP